MWKELGYADLDEFIRQGLRLDPDLIEWAVTRLQIMGRVSVAVL